jgi:hypothetical protein
MHIALATCAPKPALTPHDALLAEALERAGVGVVAAPWDVLSTAAGDSDLVCLRSTWDYHLRWPEFRDWVTDFADGGRLWNPAATVLWNADKRYLRDLGDAGIALPRTRWFEPGERPDVEAILHAWGLTRGVLKPRVSATAFGTHVVEPGVDLGERDWAPLERWGSLLQAFVPEIRSRGEISLVYLDQAYSHAVLKRPHPGDFRVQTDFGGMLEPLAPTAEVVAFGDMVLAAVRHAWLYARVDLVETERGPVLMELELIEPDLFLTPEAAARMARGLLKRAGGGAA